MIEENNDSIYFDNNELNKKKLFNKNTSSILGERALVLNSNLFTPTREENLWQLIASANAVELPVIIVSDSDVKETNFFNTYKHQVKQVDFVLQNDLSNTLAKHKSSKIICFHASARSLTLNDTDFIISVEENETSFKNFLTKAENYIVFHKDYTSLNDRYNNESQIIPMDHKEFSTKEILDNHYFESLMAEQDFLMKILKNYNNFYNLVREQEENKILKEKIETHISRLYTCFNPKETNNYKPDIKYLQKQNRRFISDIKSRLKHIDDKDTVFNMFNECEERLNIKVTQPVMNKEILRFEELEQKFTREGKVSKSFTMKDTKNALIGLTKEFYKPGIDHKFEQAEAKNYTTQFDREATSSTNKVEWPRAPWKSAIATVLISLIPVIGAVAVIGKIIYGKLTNSSLVFFGKGDLRPANAAMKTNKTTSVVSKNLDTVLNKNQAPVLH